MLGNTLLSVLLIDGVNAGGGMGTSGSSTSSGLTVLLLRLRFFTGVTGGEPTGAGGNGAASGVPARAGSPKSGRAISRLSLASPPPFLSSFCGTGSLRGDIEIACLGEWRERNHRTRPRCTPRSPVHNHRCYCECSVVSPSKNESSSPTGIISGRRSEKMANMSTAALVS